MFKDSTKSVFQFGVRQKVLLVLMCVLLTSLTVSGWFALQEEKESILKEIEQRGSDISRFVAKSLVYSVIGYDYHTIDLLLSEITSSEDVGYSKVVNLKGNTMAETGILREDDSSKMLIFKENLILNGEVVGKLTLGFSTEKTMKRLENQKYSLIKREAIILLLIAVGEIIALSFIIIKPVSIISNSLNNTKEEEGQIIGTIPLKSKDEFGELANKFNELSQNLNIANAELQSRIDYADKELIKTNNLLLDRSSELMDLNTEFKKLSVTDALTGLYNRRYFEEKLEDEIKITKRHGGINSLLLIDIDKFKVVNDSYGHMHGDTVIKEVANNIKSRLRETDIVCRIGGEEFVAICKHANEDDVIELAENVREIIEEDTMHIGKDHFNITISIGVVTFTAENTEEDVASIFRCADIALYHSKNNGRNRVTHYNDIKEKLV